MVNWPSFNHTRLYKMLMKKPGTRQPFHIMKRVRPADKHSEITPLLRARQVLGGRCQEKQGTYWLDGFPVDIFKLVEAANVALMGNGPSIRLTKSGK